MFASPTQIAEKALPTLWTVAYCSHMRRWMSEQDLAELAVCAAEKNRNLDITGVLLFHNDHFAQVIEGEHSIIEALYEKIKVDYRHERIATLTDRPIGARAFKGWAMQLISVEFIAPGLRQTLVEELDVLDRVKDVAEGASVDPVAVSCSSALVYGAMLTAPGEMGAPGTHVTHRSLAT